MRAPDFDEVRYQHLEREVNKLLAPYGYSLSFSRFGNAYINPKGYDTDDFLWPQVKKFAEQDPDTPDGESK